MTAADEITALRERVAEFWDALKPFSTGYNYYSELRRLKPEFECKAQDFILTSDMRRAFDVLARSSLSEPVQKVHELPEGHRWCRHCEQKDPHCSVCEGVGYLP